MACSRSCSWTGLVSHATAPSYRACIGDEEIVGFPLPILHMVDQASRDQETGTPCGSDRLVLGLLDEFEDQRL